MAFLPTPVPVVGSENVLRQHFLPSCNANSRLVVLQNHRRKLGIQGAAALGVMDYTRPLLETDLSTPFSPSAGEIVPAMYDMLMQTANSSLLSSFHS